MKTTKPKINYWVFAGLRTTQSLTEQKKKDYSTFILAYGCEFLGFTIDELKMNSRKRECVEARRFIYSLIRKHTQLPFVKVCAVFNQDHATVLHHLRIHSNLMDTEPTYKDRYNRLNSEIVNQLNQI